MPEYRVSVTVELLCTVTVRAASEEEAESKAREIARNTCRRSGMTGDKHVTHIECTNEEAEVDDGDGEEPANAQ